MGRRKRFTVKRILRATMRPFRRFLRRRRNRPIVIGAAMVVAFALAVTIGVVYRSMYPQINPTAYKPLLDTIADGESKGNYNAYYGHSANTSIRFTDMSVREVLQWQEKYVHDGSPSSAVGRYQIVRPTLQGLVSRLDIDPDTHFTEALQDRLAIALMERRGSVAYVQKKISRNQFAANLAQEWAALPKAVGPNPEQSYYAGDGSNVARVSMQAVLSALDRLAQG